MKRKNSTTATAAEEAYVRDMARSSAFDRLDAGKATIVRPEEFPDPVKRFLARERTTMHIRLPVNARRRLNSLSRATGIPADELAKRWVEEGLAREAG